MTGTHDGPFHGIPATHRPTAARQIHVLTFNDTGLITEHLTVRDDVTVLRQLGALPATTVIGACRVRAVRVPCD
jgi:hypothetical protein